MRGVLLQAQPVCWFLWAPTEAWVVYHKPLPRSHINSDFCLQIFTRIGKFFLGLLTPDCRLRERAAPQNNQFKLSWFQTETRPLWRLLYSFQLALQICPLGDSKLGFWLVYGIFTIQLFLHSQVCLSFTFRLVGSMHYRDTKMKHSYFILECIQFYSL